MQHPSTYIKNGIWQVEAEKGPINDLAFTRQDQYWEMSSVAKLGRISSEEIIKVTKTSMGIIKLQVHVRRNQVQ